MTAHCLRAKVADEDRFALCPHAEHTMIVYNPLKEHVGLLNFPRLFYF